MRLRQVLIIPFIALLTVSQTLGTVEAQESKREGVKLIDAVRLCISNQPSIQLQEQQIEINRGLLEVETGQFDINLGIRATRDRDNAPLSTPEKLASGSSSTLTETTSYSVSLQKLFRTGVSVSPSLQSTLTDTSPSPFDPVATGRVDFLISVPLMRGLGEEATGANEKSAKLNHEASILQLRQTVAQSVLNTITAYWNYVQTLQTLDELKDTEARARKMLDQVQELVAGDQVPAGDLEQLRANLAQKVSSRISTEQQLVTAQQQLGLAMGVPFEQFRSLPLPADPFPPFDQKAIDRVAEAVDLLLDQSLRNRGDYLSAVKIQESAKVQVVAAKNGLKPQVDLNLNLGYQGLDEGEGASKLITPFANNVPGASAKISLSYLFPVQNNSAKGLLRQNIASLRQCDIQVADLTRNIQSQVQSSVSALKNNALLLKSLQDSIDSYRLAVENEKEKFHLGTSTLLDIINTEDKLTSAILNTVSAYAAYADAVAQVRFETGMLISVEGGLFSVKQSDLLKVELPQNR